MAEANGNRTHPGLSRPRTGFEDQEHHQAPITSAKDLSIILQDIVINPLNPVNE